LEDKSKPKEKESKTSSEEIKEEKNEDVTLEPQTETEEKPKEEIMEKSKVLKTEKETQEISKEIITETNKTEKLVPKPELKKEIKKKKVEKDDFRYIVRIADTDIDGEKTLARGLTSIKGIGMHMSTLIIDTTGLDRNLKMGNLSDNQLEKIQRALENVTNTAPSWMLNHRKDIDTGKDIHLIGSEIDMRLRDEINIMKKIRSYKGIRHERGLTVRGQRTRGNNRRGLALGVSKKRVQSGK
jgi:small subunit ribosomal protein S13